MRRGFLTSNFTEIHIFPKNLLLFSSFLGFTPAAHSPLLLYFTTTHKTHSQGSKNWALALVKTLEHQRAPISTGSTYAAAVELSLREVADISFPG